MSVVRTAKSRLCEFELHDDGVVHQNYVTVNTVVELADSIETFETFRKLTDGAPALLLADITNVKSATAEARAYAETEEFAAAVQALAMVTGSMFGRVVGNFFMRVNKPKFPTRLFNERAKALEWLHTHRESAAA